ncbi:hypothetical protein [Streptomyces griseocarneus]|uniref:hypothetical protein n=1 Tax=Streptomyces griseocarneus TaxID=51201 RepID=UPI00167E8FDE|nr:hypothetical protein [Streptomyces griseocarneus]MBZ6474251.1 hypothetical protein [Streptomyces griseocarneus]GHG52876.1 hypothetical protein GCM10018779_14450 [Streptomyces griseocarneus]
MNAAAFPTDATSVPGFLPTHVVPQGGLSTWAAPDASIPTEPLDPLLPVQLLTRRGDWGQVLCSNGWAAWVDARLLVALPQSPPAAGAPLARTADARRLLAHVEESLGRYRKAVEELAEGHMDGETFRNATHGLRIGAVVEGEAVWLYDAEHDRWCYCDGTAMTTFAAHGPAPQSLPPEPTPSSLPPEPTRLDTPASGPPPTQLGDA